MKLLNFVTFGFFQFLSILFVLGYLLGILNLYFSDKNDYCAMTYMFEYPQFVKISVDENIIFPQYGLYAYSEGRYTERTRKMWFDGVPVLFLPGNSGSHMQARSLASVALRKALGNDYEYHFDFFSISYNEELSGLYGGVLETQTTFAAACVSQILNLYRNNKYTKSVPTSVILIGHSMGGLIAKRLLAHPSTLNKTNVAITLAAPLEAPIINFDVLMNNFYMLMNYEWESNINNNDQIRDMKLLISFGNGPRDLLMPSGLTSSNESYINALTTSVPGVWVSPNHVAIVWCKQLVLTINRYLFSIINQATGQLVETPKLLRTKAKHYFQVNRAMALSADFNKVNTTMQADAFWYEDNRRIYQVSRPEINKSTYLMIRLVKFPQNRFVAIEAVNVDDREWIFGCNAKYTYNTYRYCKHGISLSELSRWTGAAIDHGKRKLATIDLHTIKKANPDWSHVIVKVSPTNKPIALNIDINDYESRQITVDMPSDISIQKVVVIQETEPDSLYYELILRDFNALHQAYLLYVEPTPSCKATQYHISAELHTPWAENHENFHYFTHLKKSPMKLRLFKSNPNITFNLEPTEYAKITLLLDPQCTYTVSISQSWYHRLAQFVRYYTPVLIPYIAAIVLLAARHNIINLQERGTCVSMMAALTSESIKPYYALVFGRLAVMVFTTVPFLSFVLENASWNNLELQYFIRSLLVLPVYMTALGLVNIAALTVLIVMVFSSQIAHRFLFRIVWRGGRGLAERVSGGLQRLPLVACVALVCATPVSCGAASLAAGAAFYAFMISKIYEEFLEDYVYKVMAKVASKLCRILYIKRKTNSHTSQNPTTNITEIQDKDASNKEVGTGNELNLNKDKCDVNEKKAEVENENKTDDELNRLNFHMMLFFMWMTVTLVNVPALLTWARNFKYTMLLKPDSSYDTGLVMSVCSCYLWQMNSPKKNLKHYKSVSALLFTMAVFILALGPLSLVIVNYGVTFMFAIITIQQVCEKEDLITTEVRTESEVDNETNRDNRNDFTKSKDDRTETSSTSSNECICNEGRLYSVFKNIKEKLSFKSDDV